MNIVVNSGLAAGQDEPHYHVHIIPRRENDGFNIELPFNGSAMPDRTVLDAMAVQLIAAMRDPVKQAPGGGSQGERREKPGPSPRAATRNMPPEKEVSVRRAIEGVTTGSPDQRGVWRIEEGPHGELLFEKRQNI
jgi:hypothetical protein